MACVMLDGEGVRVAGVIYLSPMVTLLRNLA
jgi:hypothetical protein